MKLPQTALYASIAALPLSGCKTVTPSASHPRHVFGETVHDSRNVLTCIWDESVSANPAADRYLAAVAKHLAAANPKTFQDKFAIENICIYIQDDPKLNAIAARNLNTITVNSGLLLAANNDAEIASTIAHELAHLTMQSDHGEDVPPEVLRNSDWPKMRDQFESESQMARILAQPLRDQCNADQSKMQIAAISLGETLSEPIRTELTRLASIYRQLYRVDPETYISLQIPMIDPQVLNDPHSASDLPAATKTFSRDRDIVLKKITQEHPVLGQHWLETFNHYLVNYRKIKHIDAQLISFQQTFDRFIISLAGEGAKYSWKEQQADEVGYELYLRAGFDPSYMPWLQRRALSPASYNDCLVNHVQKGIAPNRDNSAHPSDCWRIYDFQYLEAHYHEKDYKLLLAHAHSLNIPQLAGQLENAKKTWQ